MKRACKWLGLIALMAVALPANAVSFTITSVTPSAVPAGTGSVQVTLTGSFASFATAVDAVCLESQISYYTQGTAITPTSVSTTQIQFTISSAVLSYGGTSAFLTQLSSSNVFLGPSSNPAAGATACSTQYSNTEPFYVTGPTIAYASPYVIAPGSAQTTVDVFGSFVSTAQGYLQVGATPGTGDTPLTTTYVSGNHIQVVIPSANLTTAASLTLAVDNEPAVYPESGGADDASFNIQVANKQPLSLALNVTPNPYISGTGSLQFTSQITNGSGTTPTPGVPTGNLAFTDGVNTYGTGPATISAGTRILQSQTASTPGANPGFSASADLNADGIPDIVEVNSAYYNSTGGNSFNVLLGTGNGVQPFQSVQYPLYDEYYQLGGSTYLTPFGVAIADFNGDGFPDIAIGYTDLQPPTPGGSIGDVLIYLNDGHGNFTLGPLSVQVNTGTYGLPIAMQVADINADGKPDIAVITNSNYLLTFLNQGGAVFVQTDAANVGSIASLTAFHLADLNGDGLPDVVFASASPVSAQNDVEVLLHGATATEAYSTAFAQPGGLQTYIVANGNIQHIAVADVSAGGKPDIVIGLNPPVDVIAGTAQLQVLTNSGSGTFTVGAAFNDGSNIAGIAVADINGDGSPDIVTSDAIRNDVNVLLNNGSGVFAAPQIHALSQTPSNVLIGDFNHDGYADVAVGYNTSATSGGNGYGLLLTTGTLTASAATTVIAPGAYSIYAAYPGDATFALAQSAAVPVTVNSPAVPLILTSISPTQALAGGPSVNLMLTGSGFTATSIALALDTFLPTQFISATQLNAVIPASLIANPGTLQIGVYDQATGAISAPQIFTILPKPVATLSGPTSTSPGDQPQITFQLGQPYAQALTGTLTLTFQPLQGLPDDPSVQFANGGRTYTFNIPANTTNVPPVLVQAGTEAGSISVTLQLTANGLNVTPATILPVIIQVQQIAPTITQLRLARTQNTLTVYVTGFASTREVQTAVFQFTAAAGANFSQSSFVVPVSGLFQTWYGSANSNQYGSAFTYFQSFNLSTNATNVQSVTVTLQNAVGSSTPVTAQ